jgi:hypothetical protein
LQARAHHNLDEAAGGLGQELGPLYFYQAWKLYSPPLNTMESHHQSGIRGRSLLQSTVAGNAKPREGITAKKNNLELENIKAAG